MPPKLRSRHPAFDLEVQEIVKEGKRLKAFAGSYGLRLVNFDGCAGIAEFENLKCEGQIVALPYWLIEIFEQGDL
jgi:hypothetical protein